MTRRVAWLLAVACLGCEGQAHEFVPSEDYDRLASGELETLDCPPGRERCGGECVDPLVEPRHCGACDQACPSGVCEYGECLSCRADETFCERACAALGTDPEHCGECGRACARNEACAQGECVSACPEALSECNGACVDLRLDVRNCGACGLSCEPTHLCSEGRCRRACREPLVECDGLCHDLETDAEHCGRCGAACTVTPSGTPTTCVEGKCRPLEEDCHNGIDDNDDGLGDCEDPACADSVRCVPQSPAGFSEPFVLVTSEGSELPSCRGPLGRVVLSGLHQGLVAEPAECSCECTTTAGCEVTVWFHDDVACAGEPWELSGSDALVSGACESVYFERDGSEGAVAIWPEISAERQTARNTQCELTAPPLEPPEWSLHAIGCAASAPQAAGCDRGTCAPKDGPPYCVAQQGNQRCPSAFPEKLLMHTDFIDDRACGACECELECPDSFLGFTDEACRIDGQEIDAELPCGSLVRDPTPTTEDEVLWETRSFLVGGPSCQPVSMPEGSAQAAGSVTVCCEAAN